MEREPYHITAIKNLIAHYSAEHFRLAIKQCRDVVGRVIADDDQSDQQRARVHILRYLDLLLSRAANWVELEADLMASVLRSQTELRFWAQFISRGEAEASQFLREADIDARELHEKMQKVAPGDVPDLPETVIGKRITLTRCSKLIH